MVVVRRIIFYWRTDELKSAEFELQVDNHKEEVSPVRGNELRNQIPLGLQATVENRLRILSWVADHRFNHLSENLFMYVSISFHFFFLPGSEYFKGVVNPVNRMDGFLSLERIIKILSASIVITSLAYNWHWLCLIFSWCYISSFFLSIIQILKHRQIGTKYWLLWKISVLYVRNMELTQNTPLKYLHETCGNFSRD